MPPGSSFPPPLYADTFYQSLYNYVKEILHTFPAVQVSSQGHQDLLKSLRITIKLRIIKSRDRHFFQKQIKQIETHGFNKLCLIVEYNDCLLIFCEQLYKLGKHHIEHSVNLLQSSTQCQFRYKFIVITPAIMLASKNICKKKKPSMFKILVIRLQ